jgi:DNA mismatch repair protein MutS
MSEKLTPLLTQYRRIKERHPGMLLLFRVGDFYEMFYEDAAVGAKALGLTLTSRPHGPDNRVPLAGVPAKALDTYVGRLVAAGFRVAVCDQLELPQKGRPVVRRDVVEVITPGTVTAPNLLVARRNNFLVAVSPSGDRFGVACCDASTGEFAVEETDSRGLLEAVLRVDPAEVLVPESWTGPDLPERLHLTRLDDYYFTEDYAFDRLSTQFGTANLAGFGVEQMSDGVCAAGAVLHYLDETQKTALGHVRRIRARSSGDYLFVDRISRRNLELVERARDDDTGQDTAATLFGVLDRTRTPAGARLLRRWLLEPLVSVAGIAARQDAVEELGCAAGPEAELGTELDSVGDLERVGSRVALERAHARDLVALAAWLGCAPRVRALLGSARSVLLCRLRESIEDFGAVRTDISTTLADDPPPVLNEGGLIRPGANAELDELRSLAANAKTFIAELQQTERKRTGIPNLRVRFNSVFGYYIEVTKSSLHLVPKNYLRKQTVANAERFITPELKEYESRVLNAESRGRQLEAELFAALRRRAGAEVGRILGFSSVLAELDVLASLAHVAQERGYVRPLVDDSTALEIDAGRHPVVEALLADKFIPNDTRLDSDAAQIAIITGPNMAGKSTYLRQVALTVIMAQTGSFVPAKRARIGIVDKVFTRIGASDDLSRGVSTFLAEMTETANILNNATSRSLVILDEVGRGTSTNDGLALAWAAVEYLHGEQVRPKTLFATHYHELTDITLLLPRARNYSFRVKEQRDNVLFLRKLVEGAADKSYGIAVARLAGLPGQVIERAKQVLAGFEKGERVSLERLAPAESDVALAADRPSEFEPVLARLRSVNPDELSPLQAYSLLVELRQALVRHAG